MSYVELPADHAMTAFLSALTPSKVLRDRELTFSKQERKRQTFLREKAKVENQVAIERMFTREEIALAQRVLAAHSESPTTKENN